MIPINKWFGIYRRVTRWRLRRRCRKGCGREPGTCYLPGYGFSMSYPDTLVWMHQFEEIFADDCYDVWMLPDDAMVLDVGGNVGTLAAFVLSRCQRAHVTVLEPSPTNLVYLRQNLAAWPESRYQIIDAAAGDRTGEGHLQGDCTDAYLLGGENGERVRVVRLQDTISGPIDLLKMDVEGGELAALRGCGESLRRVRRVVLEFHDRDSSGELLQILGCLHGAGLDRVKILPGRDVPDGEGGTMYCCLVHAWRATDDG